MPFSEELALRLEREDPLPSLRAEFAVPPWPGGTRAEWAYFAGNSLGLMPLAAREALAAELDEWGRLAVEGWFEAREPWLELAGSLRGSLGRLVGADEQEVAAAGALTVNLHLLLATFFRPTRERYRILVEGDAFPSDSHAVQSQAALHGLDPAAAVTRLEPRPGETTLRTEDVVEAIERAAGSLAVVLLGGVNYLTGALLDVEAITAAARRAGAVAGWDLAHAVGNVPLALHDWGADFAVWCHYKYVNAGPGAPAGLYVHERHGTDRSRFRLAGWWAVDPAERFRMEPGFVARAGAEGWAISTPPIVAYAPLRASLAQFDRVGIEALRARSRRLTAYLESLLDDVASRRRMTLLTPRDAEARGAQLSVATDGARARAGRLRAGHGVVCDFREPDVLRFAPAPLYNTYEDCRRAALALLDVLPAR